MKTENFNRAKEIEKEINDLTQFINPLINASDPEKQRLSLLINYYSRGGWELGKLYSTAGYYPVPNFLTEQLDDDLAFVKDRLIKKVEKKIKELTEEFESL